MPNAKFLEEYPLYRKFSAVVPASLDRIAKPNINMPCDVCKSHRTFNMRGDFFNSFPYNNYPSSNSNLKVEYVCASCEKFTRAFFIKISEKNDYIIKVGQFPAWEINTDSNIDSMLGDHKSYLKKGLISESQGYGVGAFAYYRRIVEEIIDELLDDIKNLLAGDERDKYMLALENAKSTRKTSEKIELVQDLLPPILRPDGMNPLALLHGVLSEGLHAESDERCLELAGEVREILTFLAAQVQMTKASARSFTTTMRTLLDKRNKAITGD